MKNIIYLFLFLYPLISPVQFGPQQIISNTADGPNRVIPADLNGDGFMDVVSLSFGDHQIKWYQNLDGNGNFDEGVVLNLTPALFLYFQAVDLDSDGDLDILFLENNPRRLVWRENLDGAGNFGPERILLENQSAFIDHVEALDMNDNGNQDLVVRYTNTYTDWIVWYENLDGLGNFSDEILLVDDIRFAAGPLMVDIDNDGLLDILTSNEYFSPGKLVWYKNLGTQTFGPQQIIYAFDYFISDLTSIWNIQFEDINNDGKKDIIIGTVNSDVGNFVYWLENLDSQGNFGPLQLLNLPTNYGTYSFFDLDNDGDIDILGIKHFDEIYWMENEDGHGTFSDYTIISTEVLNLRDSYAADLNNDGFLDVLSASSGDNKIAWYTNTTLGTEDFQNISSIVYPNPVKETIHIQSDRQISELKIFNTLGNETLTAFGTNHINISQLASGLYFIKISFENGIQSVEKFIKE